MRIIYFNCTFFSNLGWK